MDSVAVKVGAFMTAPRYEAVAARNEIQFALRNLNIPLSVSGGVFYYQCMQRMFQDAIARGIEYALTIDFDSMFTSEHVKRLIEVAVSNDHIDAVAAMQPRRGMKFPLFSFAPDGLESLGTCEHGEQYLMPINGQPFKVETAHFGLTIIKLDRLKNIPRPWFHSRPDRNGDWENNKIDEDIWFWKLWARNNRTIYIDPQCRIGHLEELVTTYDENFVVRHDYVKAWVKKNNRDAVILENKGEPDASDVAETVELAAGGNDAGSDAGTDRNSQAAGHCCK